MDNSMTMTKEEKCNELALSLDSAAEELKNAWLSNGNFARTIAFSLAVGKMRDALTDSVMKALVKLKNSKLGFRTDETRDNKYSLDVVRDCVIDAVTLGLQCVGNQFNIIGGNMYVTKEGFTFLLRELVRSGMLKDMKFVYHPAVISESSTSGTRKDGTPYQKIEREGKTRVDLSWTWQGKPGKESLEFCIRVNAGMSQDAIIGKAERKAKAWLFNLLTDQNVSDGEAEGSYEAQGSNYEVADAPMKRQSIKPGKPVMPKQTEVVEAEVVPVGNTGVFFEEDGSAKPEAHAVIAEEAQQDMADAWAEVETESESRFHEPELRWPEKN